MGGDCLNTGCVPSKACWPQAKPQSRGGAPAMGITAGAEPAIDFAAVKAHVADVIAGIARMTPLNGLPHWGSRLFRLKPGLHRPIKLRPTHLTARLRFVPAIL